MSLRIFQCCVIGLSVLLLYTISGAYSISCFQCNSAVDQNCDTIQSNDTRNKYYRPCEQHPDVVHDNSTAKKVFFCRKIEQHIKDMKDTVRVIRKCGWEKNPKTDCYKFEDDDHKEVVCQCFTDACNYGSSLKTFIPLHSTYLIIISCVLVYIQRLF